MVQLVRVLLAAVAVCCCTGLELTTNWRYSVVAAVPAADASYTLGELRFDGDRWGFEQHPDTDVDYSERLCVGLEVAGDTSAGNSAGAARATAKADGPLACLNYRKISPNDDIVIYTDADHVIRDFAVVGSHRNTGLKLKARRVAAGHVPEVRQADAHAAADTKDAEEDQRSFVQKYWMYIVPVVLLVAIVGDGGGQG